MAPALVQRVIEAAADTVEELRLTVVASNTTAVRLYSRRGFREYGVEPRALKIGDRYHDEVLMALPLRKSNLMRGAGLELDRRERARAMALLRS